MPYSQVARTTEGVGETNSLFLAGSIEMGLAEDWQTEFGRAFEDVDANQVTILNPRRDDWDSSWQQTKSNSQFREQVEWELTAQEMATCIAMYFAPTTKAPITLLELGLFAQTNKVIVCCPDAYWRKGNVDIVCERYNVQMVETLEELIAESRIWLGCG